MTLHTPRLTPAFCSRLLACETADKKEPAQDTESPADTAAETDTGEPLPDRLPFSGVLYATSNTRACSGVADATIIGALNIAGNAACVWDEQETAYATISGTRDSDSTAQGTIAIDDWFAEWTGQATAQTLEGSFSGTDKDGTSFEGAFTLSAEGEEGEE
ncbi:MAG: hypothetical protein ACI8S6_002738 [Myxococcota bacterium]